jgi:nucleolar protein 9
MLEGEWHTLIADSYASHLVRVVLSVLSGANLAENERLRSKKSKQFKTRNSAAALNDTHLNARLVPHTFASILESVSSGLVQKLTNREMRQMAVHPVANPVLQLLVTLKGCHQPFVDVLMEESQNPDRATTSFLVIMMKDKVGSHLMEKIIEV